MCIDRYMSGCLMCVGCPLVEVPARRRTSAWRSAPRTSDETIERERSYDIDNMHACWPIFCISVICRRSNAVITSLALRAWGQEWASKHASYEHRKPTHETVTQVPSMNSSIELWKCSFQIWVAWASSAKRLWNNIVPSPCRPASWTRTPSRTKRPSGTQVCDKEEMSILCGTP